MKKYSRPDTAVGVDGNGAKNSSARLSFVTERAPSVTIIFVIALALVVVVMVMATSVLTLFSDADQYADANTLKKIHFTQTLSSSADPSISGIDQRHIGLVLSPNEGTIYDGSMTFAASGPVDVLILHALTADDLKKTADTDMLIWTVDNQTQYAASVIGPAADAGTIEFTGAAVALYAHKEFTATVSVDGWVRGQPTPVLMQTIEVNVPPDGPHLQLARANVPAVIPMHEGMYNGKSLLYVITDVNDADYASAISKVQGWDINTAPGLDSSAIPEDALKEVYVFRNGVKGDGLYGYQLEVFSSTPVDSAYSALTRVVEVSWRPGQNWIILDSVEDITRAEEAGRIVFATSDNDDDDDNVIIANIHQIVWPSSSSTTSTDDNDHKVNIRDDAEFDDAMEYGGGQITEIDTDNMTVTFVAHRGWGPDGQTTYHIVTGATPERPAGVLGVEFVPVYASLVDSSAAKDLYIFENGVTGTGSMGFQPAIFGSIPGDDAYTPLWRVHTVEWNNPDADAGVLENISDIEAFREADVLTAGIARPTNSYYILNAPIIDPFQ